MVVVVVVVGVEGAIKVVNLGGKVLYILTEPLAQLTPLEMVVYPRPKLRLHPVEYRGLVEGVSRRPHEILAMKRCSREDEEMVGGAGDRFERNEASRRKSRGETKSTHHSNIVSCQSQVTGGS